jgi:hypothetical protein
MMNNISPVERARFLSLRAVGLKRGISSLEKEVTFLF